MTLVNHPVRYDGEEAEVSLPPQPVGAQSREILAERGVSAPDIAALGQAGVVGFADE